MIVENVVDWFFNLMTLAFHGMEIVHLPEQIIQTLSTIMAYGVWIVGLDVLGIIVTTVVTWWTIKFTVGLVVFIWELLPLT